MFTVKTDEITEREDLTLTRSVEALINQLSQPQSIFSDQKDIIIEQSLAAIDRWIDRLHFPKVRAIDPRRSGVLDEFFELLESSMRRDLSRILVLYRFSNQIEEVINAKTNSAGKVASLTKSLIVQSIGKSGRKSILDETITEYDMRDTSHVESGNFFQEPSAGTITVNVSGMTEVESTNTYESTRDLFVENPYSVVDPDVSTRIEQGVLYYDTNPDPLDIELRKTAEDGFYMMSIDMDTQFEVVRVEADNAGNGALEDITTTVIGNSLLIQGSSFSEPTTDSLSQPDGVNRYSIWFPELTYSAKVTIRLSTIDAQPVQIASLLDNHGDRMREYSAQDSLLITRQVFGEEYRERIEELNRSTSLGDVFVSTDLRPIRKFTLLGARVSTPGTVSAAEGRIRTVNSRVGISAVELYVDSYDPESLIEFFVDSTRGERIPISPSNRNAEGDTRVEFESPYPSQVTIIASIPANGDYYPTIGGIVVRTKEVVG